MDLLKIGKFIKSCRKEKGLTQLQLANELLVSEKTISKWECGNGFPDTSLMLPLCERLGISANELLSGAKLKTENEYKEQAEKNLLCLKQEQEKNAKFLLGLEWIIGVLSFIIILFGSVFAGFMNVPNYMKVVIVLLSMFVGLIGFFFCFLIEKDAGYYECKNCNHKYVPTYKQVFLSPHFGRTRYMKCHKCGKRCWQKKSISNDD